MKERSLARRVLTIVLGAQLLCALLLSCFALLNERHTRLRAFEETLRGRTASVLGAIQDAEDTRDTVMLDPRELRLPATDRYRVYSADGAVVGGSPNVPAPLLDRGNDGYHDVQVAGVPYRVYQRSAVRIVDRDETGGVGRARGVVIVYASSTRYVQHEIREAAGAYCSIIVLVMVGTGVAVVLLVRRALVPLVQFADAAGRLTAPSLSFEAPASVLATRELRPLAQALDDVTGRLRDAFAKERRFLGDAAHELKTAVAVVRSTAQVLMLKQRAPEEYAAGLKRVVEDVGRVESLVAQMLNSAGAEEANPADLPALSLRDAAVEAVEVMRSYAEERRVQLMLEGTGEFPVRLRADRAAALLSNLLLNAIQHSEAGMSVRAILHGDEAGGVVLRVIDTGSGIGEAALPHVFERFYREDRSRSRETGGAGLGLAICKSIVEAAGGAIAIESAPGQGTTVVVTFIKT